MSSAPLLPKQRKLENAAFVISEAMLGRSFDKYPEDPMVMKLHRWHCISEAWVPVAVIGLLLLTLFETPLWCNEAAYWRYLSARERCAVEGKAPVSEVLMSGLPLLPIGTGIVLETALLGLLGLNAGIAWKLNQLFKPLGEQFRSSWLPRYVLALIGFGFLDILRFIIKPNAIFRFAPYIRLLLCLQVPAYLRAMTSFVGILKAITVPSIFLLGSIVLFAWVAALLFDDLDTEARPGMPVNQGFESFGNALYTSYVVGVGGAMPNAMVPTYEHNRAYFFLWLVFLTISLLIFMQVILGAVYSHYLEMGTESIKVYVKNRMAGVKKAFTEMAKVSSKGGKPALVIELRDLLDLADALRVVGVPTDPNLVEFIFNALDDDGNGLLTAEEFYDMCDVLQYNFRVTMRDSALIRNYPKSTASRMLLRHLDNKPGSTEPDFGYQHRFDGSTFAHFMNIVLGINVVFVLVESWYDLRNVKEPQIFFSIDLFFSFVYLGEVIVKLSRWSMAEYWTSLDNRFDFVTSIILATAGIFFITAHVSKDVLRFLNMLRFIRLLKALSNIPIYQKVCSTVAQMLMSSKDILMMNFLVVYLWSAIGVQMFGGELYKDNEKFKGLDLDYFNNHYDIFNFNDMLLGLLTLFWFMICGWVDEVVLACTSLAELHSFHYFAITGFFLSAFFAANLLAFNVFGAYSIDVYMKLSSSDLSQEKSAADVDKNMERVRVQLAQEEFPRCLHFAASAELTKQRIYKDMLGLNEEEEENAAEEEEEEEKGDKKEEEEEES